MLFVVTVPCHRCVLCYKLLVFMSLLSHHVSAIQFNLFSLSLLQELGGHNPETLCELEFEKGKAGDLNFPDVYRWPDGIEVHIFPGDVPTREDSYFNCCCYDVSLMLSQYFVTSLSLVFCNFSQELEDSRDRQIFMADEAPLQSILLQLQSIQTSALRHSVTLDCQERRQKEYEIIPPSQPEA